MTRILSLGIRIVAVIAGVIAASITTLAPAHAATYPPAIPMVLKSTVTSSGTTLNTLPGGITYGWNDLNGPTTWGKQQAAIHFQGDVNYLNGSGPFNGYVTVTGADGTVLAFRVEGSALAVPLNSGATETHFAGDIKVIGGTGTYANAKGIGTMVGTREAALGSPVRLTFRLTVLPART